MAVMLQCLAEIHMEISLLEMGLQLMTLPTMFFCAMNVTPYWCFESFLQYQNNKSFPKLFSFLRHYWLRKSGSCCMVMSSGWLYLFIAVLWSRLIQSLLKSQAKVTWKVVFLWFD